MSAAIGIRDIGDNVNNLRAFIIQDSTNHKMLYLTGTTLNVQSLMGVIFLVGIAVNNGVLLVDFANRSRLNGTSAREAICAAASTRFRPILMTFLATVLALTPMALGTGRGNEANVPLARAVVGGLFSSTFLTLFLVPILYTIIVRKFNAVDPRLAGELGDNTTGPIVSL